MRNDRGEKRDRLVAQIAIKKSIKIFGKYLFKIPKDSLVFSTPTKNVAFNMLHNVLSFTSNDTIYDTIFKTELEPRAIIIRTFD